MGEENKRMPESGKPPKKERKVNLRNIFYHNTFVLVFSILAAVVIWFFMKAGSDGSPYVIYDVPIEVKLSAAAEEEGLKVYNSSYTTADISVTGNSMIVNKLKADNFSVSATLNPTSNKLTTGNTLQKIVLPVRTEKKNAISDYSIVAVNPEEITVEFDRNREVTFPIEDNVKYSADSHYYAGTATFSEDSVTISGPESSVNKISRVAAEYTVPDTLREDKVISSCSLTLYDQNNQKITDYSGMYLSMSTETVEITIPVMPKKTVPVVANTINGPKNFPAGRITVEPAQIDIAAPTEVLSAIEEIALTDVIDFSELSPNKKNEFESEIPLPAGAKNITNLAEGNMSTAKVTVNLNGYEEARVTTANISVTKKPAGKNVELTTKSLEVILIGSEAQVGKLTGDSVSCTVDMTNYAEQTGIIEVPVTVTVSGADSCWSVGSYSVYVTITDKNAVPTTAKEESSAGGVAAHPQE